MRVSETLTPGASVRENIQNAETPKFEALNLVHGWDGIKNVHFYSLLGFSTHENVKCYATMTKKPKPGSLQTLRSV